MFHIAFSDSQRPACWRFLLQIEPVWTLKLSNHSQSNLYDQKEESFLFVTSVNIICKTSLIMEKEIVL